MTPWQRGPVQFPGDLFLDPTLPDSECVRVSSGAWTALATHVWTGTGWSRLLTTPVRLVPGARADAAAATTTTGAAAARLAS